MLSLGSEAQEDEVSQRGQCLAGQCGFTTVTAYHMQAKYKDKIKEKLLQVLHCTPQLA